MAAHFPWEIQPECSTHKPATGPIHKTLQHPSLRQHTKPYILPWTNTQRPITAFPQATHKALQHPSLGQHTKPYNILHRANTQSPKTSFTGSTHKALKHPSLGQHTKALQYPSLDQHTSPTTSFTLLLAGLT